MVRARVTSVVAAIVLVAGLLAVTGCDLRVLYGPPSAPEAGEDSPPSETVEDRSLLAVVQPAGTDTFHPGDVLPIRWTGSLDSPAVVIELYQYGALSTAIADSAANTGSYDWVIPEDFDTVSEAPDEYQVSLRAQVPGHSPGDLYVQAFSESFTIIAEDTGGLTDVTVGQPVITITVTDNGQQIDGDTVDIVLNGTTLISGHVLAEPPGTEIELVLQTGDNVLEIVAINEGSVSPNTAELSISDVVLGESVQEWRLLAGERGSLTITAP